MDLASIRMITDDLEPVVRSYEQVTGVSAVWPASIFAELHMPSCTIAFGHTRTAQMSWGNRSILFRDPDGNLVNLFTPVTE